MENKLENLLRKNKAHTLDENIGEELRFSRRLDVHTWSDHPEVNSFVDAIFLEFFEGRKYEILRKHVKVVLLDLYVAWCEHPELKIAYSRNNNDYEKGSIYNELHITRTTIRVVDILKEHQFLNTVDGFNDRRTGKGFLSRMWPTKKLVDLFKNARFSLYNITWQTARTTLELRDKEKKKIEFDLNDDLQSMSDLIKAYNELLQQTFVSIPSLKSGKTESEDDDKTPVIVSHAKKFSRRIFNDSSFERGGRFYGGWWQNCPKEIRTEIFIDDCMTNELDYSGLHPTLLYAEEGIDFHKEIGGDLYEIGPIDFVEINSGRRLAKDLLLIMINADDLNTIPSAFRRKQQKGSPLARLKDVQIFDVVEALKIKHRAISKHFHTGAGLRLQYLDSEITALIVDSFLKRNEPILLVHDSYIVRSGFEELLEDAMQLAFATVTGTNFATKIKYIDLTREDVEGLLNRNYDLRYGRKGTEQQEAEDMELYRKIAPMRSNWYKNDLRLFNLWKEELKQNLHDDWGL